MGIPYSSSGVGNVLRLSSLKNATGRNKILPGAEFLEDLDAVGNDFSGIADQGAMQENFAPEPEGGGQAQSYDVRANQTIPEKRMAQEERNKKLFGQPDFWQSMGQNLAGYANQRNQNAPAAPQTPPIETQQTDLQEGLPPVSASQEEQGRREEQPGVWSRVGNAFKKAFTPEIAPEYAKQFPDIAEQLPQFKQQIAEEKQIDQQEMDRSQETPWEIAVYGATDKLANSPELVSQLEQYTGINFSPETKALTEKYEKVMSDIENGINADQAGYDTQAKRIEERILANQATDMDKYYIGLALLMPLVLGGIFGAEAGLGAAGGAAQGIADVYGNRNKNIQADEELLSEVNKQKGALSNRKNELQLEKLKIPSEVQKLLPPDEYEDLKGMDIVAYKDPNTGEIVAEGPKILPDFVADLSYYNTPKKREEAAKKASELSQEKAALQRANDATKDVVKAALQLKEPGIIGKIISVALSEDDNGIRKKLYKQLLAPTIIIDGRKVNSAVYLDSKIEQIKDAYRRNEKMQSFTNTIANHVGQMAENPQYSGLTPEDLITQMLILRDRGQSFFIDRATAQGFLKEPFVSLFGKENRDLYKNLNKKEEQKATEADKQMLYKNG